MSALPSFYDAYDDLLSPRVVFVILADVDKMELINHERDRKGHCKEARDYECNHDLEAK